MLNELTSREESAAYTTAKQYMVNAYEDRQAIINPIGVSIFVSIHSNLCLPR